jgi:Arc/MetJ-type ribon-helix-helix transcriptional regulator
MVSVILPEKMSDELEALISAGYYDNKSEIMRDAFRQLLANRKELRLVIALELYNRGKATVSRAAEVAGVSFEDMKTVLSTDGIIRRGMTDAGDIKKKAKKLQETE